MGILVPPPAASVKSARTILVPVLLPLIRAKSWASQLADFEVRPRGASGLLGIVTHAVDLISGSPDRASRSLQARMTVRCNSGAWLGTIA